MKQLTPPQVERTPTKTRPQTIERRRTPFGISPIVFMLIFLAGIILFAALSTKKQQAAKPTVTVGIATWPGYGPGIPGVEKNFFEGLNVEFKVIDDLTARDAAFRGGQIDVLASSADLWVQEHEQGLDGKIILVTDESFGADAILVNPSIKSIEQLQGKKIAFARATPSHYLLYKILQKAHLTPDQVVQLKVEDPSNAGQAFAGGSVDAAVTWEPFISTTRRTGKGVVLASSKDFPGTIVDVLVASPSLLQKKDVLDKFIHGWLKSADFVRCHPEQAAPSLAHGFNIKEQDVITMLKGLRVADRAMNARYLSAMPGQPSKLDAVLQDAGEFWYRQGIIANHPHQGGLISPEFCHLTGSQASTLGGLESRHKIASNTRSVETATALSVVLAYCLIFYLAIVRTGLTASLTFNQTKKARGSALMSVVYCTTPLFALSCWTLLSHLGPFANNLLPAPFDVIRAFARLLNSGTLISESLISLHRILIGFTTACVVSIPLGLLAGSFLVGQQLITPVNSFLRYIPPTAFVALLIVYFGVGETFKYAVVFVGVVFFLIQMIIDVVEDLELRYVEMGKTSDFSNWYIFTHVVLPYSGPRLLDVLRINLSAAWTFLVVAELVGSEQGLGHFISISQRYLRMDELYAGIIMFGLIGLSTDLLLQLASRKLFRWHQLLAKR